MGVKFGEEFVGMTENELNRWLRECKPENKAVFQEVAEARAMKRSESARVELIEGGRR